MDGTAARVLMGDSLGFHIILAMFGVGLPLVISLFEWYALRTKNQRLLSHVQTWSKVAVVLVVAGVISGTIISFQMALMWPTFMKLASPVVGPSFMIEGYAFLLEAIFLAFYVFSWPRIKGYRHWLISLPMVLGSTASSIFITTVNGWMNQPTGFVLKDGNTVGVNYISAAFSTTSNLKNGHTLFSYYAATALVLAGIYSWFYLRRKTTARQKPFYRFVASRLYVVGAVCLVAVMIFGDSSARYLAHQNPVKLAAYEIHANTSSHAPLYIGGQLNRTTGQVEGAIKIPSGLSVLVGDMPNKVILGLNNYPLADQPSLVVHPLFDSMVILGTVSLLVPLAIIIVAGFRRYTKNRLIHWLDRPLWRLGLVTGPLVVVVIELGWAMAEIGRQPYTIYGLLRTKDAFTQNDGVVQFGYIFPVLYVILLSVTAVATVMAIKRYAPKKGQRD